jgi:photosystem II stability/assembly factor-like uncharacterized protein
MKKLLISMVITNLLLCLPLQLSAQHNWIRTNPGGGGTIATVGATASGILLTASDLSGVYRSADDGKHWQPLGANQGIIETNTLSLAFHPEDGNTFFVGTGSAAYKTVDGGNHFTQVHKDAYIRSIVIAESNPNIGYITHQKNWINVWANAPSEVYKTTDGGNTWKAIIGQNLPNNLHIIKLTVHPTDENIVYALTGKARVGCSPARLYRSVDGGIHWSRIGALLGNILDADLHPSNPDIIFLSTFIINSPISCTIDSDISLDDYLGGDIDNPGALYKSSNGGLSFDKLTSTGSGNNPNIAGIINVNIDNPNIIRLANILYPYDFPGNGSWVFNPKAGIWESTDGGQTWAQLSTMQDWNAGYAQNTYFALLPSFYGLTKTITKDQFVADRFYSSLGSWAWASFDGGQTLNNISTQEISADTWLSTGVENIVGHGLDVSDSNPNVIYMAGYDIGFWYSRNHGKSWRLSIPDYHQYQGFSWFEGGGSNVSTLLNDPERENVVWASFSDEQYTDVSTGKIATTGMFKSNDYGEHWQLVGHGNGLPIIKRDPTTGELIPNPASIRMYGLSLDILSPINNRTLYMTLKGDIYKSTNDGQSWFKKSNQGGLKFTAVDKFNRSLVYAGGKKGLWRSIDAGNTWAKVGILEMEADENHQPMREEIVPTGIDWLDSGEILYPWEGVFEIQTDPNIPNRVYVSAFGEGKGLYRSDDAGLSWRKLRTDNHMRGIAIAPNDSNFIYVTSSENYYSGGDGNSAGIQYSTDAGNHWKDANEGMAWNYGGKIEIETGTSPYVWAWSPGTGIQRSVVPGLAIDSDGDGIIDPSDNCIMKKNHNQRDTDQDGYGNICDADLDNNGSVSFADLNLFRSAFGTNNADADFDGNGSVSFGDLNIFRSLFGQPPGPAGEL